MHMDIATEEPSQLLAIGSEDRVLLSRLHEGLLLSAVEAKLSGQIEWLEVVYRVQGGHIGWQCLLQAAENTASVSRRTQRTVRSIFDLRVDGDRPAARAGIDG